MKRFGRVSAVGVSLVACCLSVSAPAVLAATTPSSNSTSTGQALEIAPPIITLTVNPGQTIKTQISLRDVSSGNLIVSSQVNDFVAAGEDGTPKILLNGSGNNPYSLRTWITPPATMLMVPKQIKTIPVTISVPANASPGGHYGVIRFSATPPELQGTGVSLSASLGALVLLTVNGNITDSLAVQEFSANHNGKTGSLFESAPINFVERIKNTGNIQEQPAGQVIITDMFGRKVAGVNVNLPPRYILPASIRKFSEPLDSSVIGNKRLFGRYHATLNLTYGTSKKTVSSSMTFWVIPYKLIAVIIILLIGGFFGLRFFIRRYNRRIIAKANGSKGKKK